MKRIIFIILTPLILITLLLSSVEFALKPWLNQFVKMKINQFENSNLPLNFQVNKVEFNFMAPEVTIEQIVITPHESLKQTITPMTIEKIHARVNPFKLMIGQLNLSVLEVIQPQLDINLDKLMNDPNPSKDIPIGQIFEITNFLPIENVLIDQAQLNIISTLKKWKLNLHQTKIILSSQKNLISAKLELAKNEFIFDDHPPIESQLILNIRMTPKKIVSDFAQVQTKSINVQVQGECIQLEKLNQSPNCVMNVQNEINLNQFGQTLAQFQEQAPIINGLVKTNGKLQIIKNQISGSAEIKTENVQINQFKLGNAQVKGKYTAKGLELSELTIQHPAGVAQLNDTIVNFNEQVMFDTRIKVQKIDLQKLFTNLNLKEIPVWLNLSADLPCQGKLGSDLLIQCQGSIDANGLKIQSNFHQSDSTIVAIERLLAKGKLSISNEKIEYDSMIQIGHKSFGKSQGSIIFKDGFDIYFKADQLHFNDVQNLANIDFGGVLQLEGSTQGDTSAAVFKMKLNSQNLKIQKFDLGQMTSELSYEKGQLFFENIQGLVGEMGLVGNLALDFNQSQIQGKVFSQNADLKFIQQIIAGLYQLPIDIAGNGAIKIDFSGPFDFWKMNLSVDGQFSNVIVATENFDRLVSQIKSENGKMKFNEFKLVKNKSQVGLTGFIENGSDIHLEIKGQNLLLEESQFFNHISEKIFGHLNFLSTIGGNFNEPLFNLSGQINHTVIDEQEIEDSYFNVQSNKSRMNISANLFADKIKSAIQLPMGQSRDPLMINLETIDWDFAAFIALINSNKLINSYKSNLSLSVQLKSDLGQMNSVSGQAIVHQLLLKKANIEIKNENPALVFFKNGNMTFQDFNLKGTDSEIQIEGQNFRFDQMNLLVKTQLNLNIIHLFLPFLEDIGGFAEANATIQGSVVQPKIFGNLSLKNAFIKIPGLPHPIEKLNSEITFSHSKIQINSINSQFAGGQLLGDGQILMNGPQDMPINLRTRLEKVTLNIPDRVRTQGNADLLISGKWFPFLLSGTYDVQSALIDKEFGGDASAAQVKQSNYLPKIIKDDSFTPLKFDIQVLLAKNILIKNSILNAGISGQLQVKGTPSNPILLGKINTEKAAKLNFKDKTFEIQSGIIAFNDESEINPDLFISAQSRVSDYDVNLLIQGLAKNLQFKMSSVPPLSDQEIVSLLALGITSSKLDSSVQSKDQQAQTGYEIGAAIFSNNPLSKKLKETLGINLQLTSSFDSTKNITVPKMTASRQLTEKLSAMASRSLGGEEITYDMQLNYMINNTLSAVGSWESKESENATSITTGDQNKSSIFGLDLEYKKEFK